MHGSEEKVPDTTERAPEAAQRWAISGPPRAPTSSSGCELSRQAPELLTMRPQRMKTHPEEGSQALDVLLLTLELLFHSPSARGYSAIAREGL